MLEQAPIDGGADGSRVWSWRRAGVIIAVGRDLIATVDELTDAERRWLSRLELGERRRSAWARGRKLAHRFLAPGSSVVADDDGVPRAVGLAVGFAHDGRWDAAVIAPCRPAVIAVVAGSPARAAAALRRASAQVTTDADPAETCAAIACAIKLATAPVADRLELVIEVVATIDGLEVSGLGRPVDIQVASVEDVTVAWATGGIL